MNNAEETCCRFCAHPLPSWSSALLPAAAQHIPEPPVAVMAVVYGERVAKVPVRPGPEGEAEFKVRRPVARSRGSLPMAPATLFVHWPLKDQAEVRALQASPDLAASVTHILLPL
jgi:hypothetical protein